MSAFEKKKKFHKRLFGLRKTLFVICLILLTAGILIYNIHKTKISYAIKVLTTNHHTISYDAGFYPEFIVIRMGDSVTIKNSSQKPMEIATGRHENHKTLQGFQEKIIKPETKYTFTPQEKGVFDLHNHLDPKKLGTLIIDE